MRISRHTICHLFLSIALVGACGLAQGCRTATRPISTSIEDLISESKPVAGPALEHHEVFSIGGVLPIPDVGLFYHYPSHQRFPHQLRTLPPGTAVGISRNQSYRIETVMGANLATKEVDEVVEAIEGVNQVVREAIALMLLKAQLQNTSGTTNHRAEVEALEKQIQLIDANVTVKLEIARKAANRPGIIVANWLVGHSKGSSLTAGNIAGLAASKNSRRTGFVVLGGIRVSHLFLGDDLKRLVLNLQPEDRAVMSQVGVATYILQARHVRYVADLDLDAAIKAFVELSSTQLHQPRNLISSLDKVRFERYVTSAARSRNQGSLEGAVRKLVQVDVGKELATTTNILSSVDGWQTVHAVLTSGDRLFDVWGRKFNRLNDVRLPEVSLGSADVNSQKIRDLNQKIREVNAILKNDKSYLVKTELANELRDLRQALSTARPKRLEDQQHLHEAATQLNGLLSGLDDTYWGGVALGSPKMKAVLLHLENATAAIRQITSRH